MRLASWLSAILCRRGESFEHDPEKWEPVFGRDHAQGKHDPEKWEPVFGRDHAQGKHDPEKWEPLSDEIMREGNMIPGGLRTGDGVVRFENVGLRYGLGPEVLRDLNFAIEPQSFQFLTG